MIRVSFVAFTLWFAACGTSGDRTPPPADAGPSTASSAEAGAAVPLFLIHTAIQGTSGRTNYFSLVDSLGAPRKLDYGSSLELPGRARLYADQRNNFFALGGGESPIITRYSIAADGKFVEGPKLSLAQHGVKAMGAQAVLFVSPTKAYFKDPDQNQVIVWNPETMTVTRSLALPKELVPASLEQVLSYSQWGSRPGEAFFAAGVYSKTWDRAYPGTTLVRIDTTTDAVSTVAETRCRGLSKTAALGGTLYFFSDVINGFGHAVYPNDGGQADCFLRIAPGQAGFDPGFVGTFSQAFGQNEAVTAVALTDDGRAWLQVADLTVTPRAPGTKYGEWYAKGWTWASVPLASPTTVLRVAAPAGAYEGIAFTSGSDFFISHAKADYSETSLMNVSTGTPTPGLTFPGFTLDVVRVR